MIRIGQYNLLKVVRKVSFGVYLAKGEESILLPAKYVPPRVKEGDIINVFVYTDSEDRPVATTQNPAGCVGDIVSLTVVSANQIGAFLDWNLDKDLFVPFKEMANKQMIPGKKYLVEIRFDEKSGRIIASNRFDRAFKRYNPQEDLELKQPVNLIVYGENEVGFKVMVDRKYNGIIYKSELFKEVKIGDYLSGYVQKIRDDGKVDIVVRQEGRAGVISEVDGIVERLKNSGGFLPFNSKSSAEEIKQEFKMSKSVFKQIIGKLYKERQIVIEESGIRLVECDQQPEN